MFLSLFYVYIFFYVIVNVDVDVLAPRCGFKAEDIFHSGHEAVHVTRCGEGEEVWGKSNTG